MAWHLFIRNHDLTNPLMHQIWREHFGPEWYSFDYRGVHFMWLTRVQGESPHGFQFTPVIVDIDQPGEAPCRFIWRGTAEVDQRNTNFGQFILADVVPE